MSCKAKPDSLRMPPVGGAKLELRPREGRARRSVDCLDCPHYWLCRVDVRAGRPAHCEATAVQTLNNVTIAW